jgi:hypothetical protein
MSQNMNPSLAPLKFIRYVESRRIHLPKVFSKHALQLQYEAINLGGLQTRWKKKVEDERFWEKNKLVGRRPICSRWVPDFDDTTVAQVEVARDPADVYSLDDSDVSSKRLLITFNKFALNCFGSELI